MATMAERVKARTVRKGTNAKRTRKLAQRKPKDEVHKHHEPKRAAKKATYAKETVTPGARPSRKSTRASANRAKADSNLVLRDERAMRAPSNRSRAA